MVGSRGETPAGERLGHALGGGAAGAVDDAALVLPRAHEIDDLLQRLVLGGDAVGEVGAVEARDERHRRTELQVRDDVLAHAAGRGGGERHQRHAGQGRAEAGELAILGTEVVAPLRHAVGLVDGEAGDVPRLQIFAPAVEHQPLRGDVEELELAAVKPPQPGA